MVKDESGDEVELSARVVLGVPALAEPRGAQGGVPPVLRRSSPPTRTRSPRRSPARCSATSTTPRPATTRAPCEAALFPDNVPMAVYDNLIAAVRRNLPAALPLLRPAPAEDEAQGHSSLRHLRADPQRPAKTQHTWDQAVEGGDRVARAAGQRVLRRAREGPARPLVRSLPEPGQAERRVQQRHVTTATRTS